MSWIASALGFGPDANDNEIEQKKKDKPSPSYSSQSPPRIKTPKREKSPSKKKQGSPLKVSLSPSDFTGPKNELLSNSMDIPQLKVDEEPETNLKDRRSSMGSRYSVHVPDKLSEFMWDMLGFPISPTTDSAASSQLNLPETSNKYLMQSWESIASSRRAFSMEESPVKIQFYGADNHTILKLEVAKKLRTHLSPMQRESSKWNMTYSLEQHGISLNTLYSNCENRGPALIAIKDTLGNAFGAFSSDSLEIQKGFFGNGDSFLWKFNEKEGLDVFHATGANEYLILCEPHCIAFGGGEGRFGLWIDEELLHGHSDPCETFRNDPLTDEKEFQITSLEIWTFELAGLILIGGGAYITSQGNPEQLANLTGSIASAAIVIGIIITAISFFGCFGAANEKGILLKTYFAFLVLLIILEFSVGAAALAKRNEIDVLIQPVWKFYYQQSDQTQLKNIEMSFKCCGFKNTTDMAVPKNCESSDSLGFTTSCFDAITTSLQASLNTIAGAGIALAIIEILGLVMSAMLFNRIAKRQDANNSLLNETWRINQNKVQYGYQNYQYA